MSKHSGAPEVPRWTSVYLVCKACGKRSDGPKEFKPKAVVAALRQRSQDRSTSRVLFSSCLGLCPKGAVAVARVGGDSPASIAAIRSPAQLDTAFGRPGSNDTARQGTPSDPAVER